jgi:DNA-binding beta-propeller fold protein YncE
MAGRPRNVRIAIRLKRLLTAHKMASRKASLGAALMAAVVFSLAALAQDVRSEDELKLLRKIDLPGVNGRIDHMAIDLESNRLFVAALGNNSVEVVDMAKGSVAQSLPGFPEPQGVLLLPETHELVVTNGGSRHADVYDSRSLRKIKSIELKEDNDNIRYDANAKLGYVGCGSGRHGALAILDLTRHAKAGEIALSGHPESFQLEQTGTRIFVNVPTSGAIEVIDRRQGRVVSAWQVSARRNYPMALDEAHHRLFIGTRDPAKLLVLDTETGKTTASLDSVGDADEIFYVPASGKIYVSGGEGFVYIFRQQDAERYSLASRVATATGARTSLYVPERNQLLVAAPKTSTAPARILVYALEAR